MHLFHLLSIASGEDWGWTKWQLVEYSLTVPNLKIQQMKMKE